MLMTTPLTLGRSSPSMGSAQELLKWAAFGNVLWKTIVRREHYEHYENIRVSRHCSPLSRCFKLVGQNHISSILTKLFCGLCKKTPNFSNIIFPISNQISKQNISIPSLSLFLFLFVWNRWDGWHCNTPSPKKNLPTLPNLFSRGGPSLYPLEWMNVFAAYQSHLMRWYQWDVWGALTNYLALYGGWKNGLRWFHPFYLYCCPYFYLYLF